MRSRSRMAFWTIAASFVISTAMPTLGHSADEPKVENIIRLDIQITGLGKKGAKIEIKPAHPGCQFDAVEKTIEEKRSASIVKLAPINVKATSTGVDRDCSFEIVVTEPGQTPKTFRRGLQLTPGTPGGRPPARTLKCHLPAATVALQDNAKTGKARR